MIQGSKEWHTWRTKGIGASDTPIILGISPYKKPYQLWEEKVGRRKDDSQTYATTKGNLMEGIAREHYELYTGIKMVPKSFTHPVYKNYRCSLDGWNEVLKIVLEIKCPGKKAHDQALGGEVPKHYWYQMQHQLFVTGANTGHYWSFDGLKGTLLYVRKDFKAVDEIIKAGDKFWHYVETQTPPPKGISIR